METEHKKAVEEIEKRIVGMTVESAREQLKEGGWSLRLVCVDGKSCIGTADMRSDRINAKAESGIITEYVGNG